MSLPLTGAGPSAAGEWTPASPTSSGGVLPHTWHYAGSGALYQDSGKTTPAVSDGDAIGASVNQGSDTHDIVQATTAVKPTLKLSILNSEAVYRLDGGDYLQGAFNAAISQPVTIYCVAQLDASVVNNNTAYQLLSADDGTNRMRFRQADADPDVFSFDMGATLNGPASDSSWHIWSFQVNGVSSIIRDGGVSKATGSMGTHNPDGLTVGSSETATLKWIGDFAELLIYDPTLSTADLNQLGNYLATKFALSWTTIT